MPTGADLRDYLAVERTLLAWIRTGLALMGFGFVVARFGLFLQQIQLVNRSLAPQPTGPSLWFGTALIVAGILVHLSSAWRHVHLVRQLDQGGTGSSRSPALALATAIFLAVVGLAMAIYLLSVRTTAANPSVREEITMPADNGIVTKQSHHSVEQTVARLKNLLEAKGIMLFAVVDHSGEAAKVGLTMPDTKLLIFGSPKAGTPLMLAAPSVALDLPLKILVAEGEPGRASISYNSPHYLQARHDFPLALLQNLAALETLAAQAAE
jgi:uncharacterized protein (DUF302 family)/uncharacterized membrane protein YidH (DUF202 family)